MTDKQHNDKQAKCRAIIDDAIAELHLLGMDSTDDAALLMAIQSIIRINCPEKLKQIAEFACEWAEDDSEGEP